MLLYHIYSHMKTTNPFSVRIIIAIAIIKSLQSYIKQKKTAQPVRFLSENQIGKQSSYTPYYYIYSGLFLSDRHQSLYYSYFLCLMRKDNRKQHLKIFLCIHCMRDRSRHNDCFSGMADMLYPIDCKHTCSL